MKIPNETRPTIESYYGADILHIIEPPGLKIRVSKGFRPPRRGDCYLKKDGSSHVAATDYPAEMPRLLLIDRDYEFIGHQKGD